MMKENYLDAIRVTVGNPKARLKDVFLWLQPRVNAMPGIVKQSILTQFCYVEISMPVEKKEVLEDYAEHNLHALCDVLKEVEELGKVYPV
jgi:hypothetical protein